MPCISVVYELLGFSGPPGAGNWRRSPYRQTAFAVLCPSLHRRVFVICLTCLPVVSLLCLPSARNQALNLWGVDVRAGQEEAEKGGRESGRSFLPALSQLLCCLRAFSASCFRRAEMGR